MNDIYKAYKNTSHPLHKDHPNKKTPSSSSFSYSLLYALLCSFKLCYI